MLTRASISAHHGCINRENELGPTIELLTAHPEINIIEIDFISHEGKFISSHDYELETIKKGSELSEWLNHIIPLNKIIWIDIKDSNSSIISKELSVFDIDKFFDLIQTEKEKFLNQGTQLKDYLIISSQYESITKKIYEKQNLQIAYDVPYDYAYAMRTVVPSVMENLLNRLIQKLILSDVADVPNIVCLDISFFVTETELVDLINKLRARTIILYTLKNGQQMNLNITNKQIIYQHDFLH
jgi:hypothetical protein